MATPLAAFRADGELSLRFPDGQRTRARFGEEVVDVVTNQLVGGGVPAQTPLPSEAEMAEGFGVSRTVIREAMKELETMGLVEKHAGKRTWTAPASSWNLLDPRILHARVRHDPDFSFIDDVMAVRTALEAEMAAQVASRASDDELAELGRICNALEANLHRLDTYLELDTLFHNTIMRTSRNQLAMAVVTAIHSHARVRERFIGQLPAKLLQDLLHLTQEGHTAIFDRLRERDAAGAKSAMRAHIGSTWAWRRTHPEWQR
jgi:GntR family transcriptional regulator, galactonate operon transcriptional repressor